MQVTGVQTSITGVDHNTIQTSRDICTAFLWLTWFELGMLLLARFALCAVPINQGGSTEVIQHRWGQDLEALGPAFDIVVACGKLH